MSLERRLHDERLAEDDAGTPVVGLLCETDEAFPEDLHRLLPLQQAQIRQIPVDGLKQPAWQGSLPKCTVPGRSGDECLFPRLASLHPALLLLQQEGNLLCNEAGCGGVHLWEGETLSQWQVRSDHFLE